MSKKWMVIAGVLALAVVLIAAALFSMPRKTSSPSTPNAGTTSSTTPSTTPSTGSTGTTPGQDTTSATTTSGTNPSQTTTSGTNSSGSKADSAGPLKPFPLLPDPHVPAQNRTSPAAPGQTLPPLTVAPSGTISGLKLGQLFSRAQYKIVMRPFGIGPSSVFGSRVVVRVDSATPVGKTPVYKKIVNANLLVLADTTNGGAVTKGGTYKATLTFRSDGTKLLPILTHAKVTK